MHFTVLSSQGIHKMNIATAGNPFSIVIITLNESERIENLLSDIAKQTYQNFEVIVVDSDSNDNTRDLAKAFADRIPNLTIHNMHTKGVSLGRNTGAKLAKHERLLFLDADVRLEPDFLAKAETHLSANGIEVAGVYMSAKDLPLHYKIAYIGFNAGMYLTQFGFPTAVGACILSTKRAHQQLGGFDQEIQLCEDCDYVKRASKTWRFRFIPVAFSFDPRRLKQDGFFSTGLKYLHANVRRFFFGELKNNEIEYKFGHYEADSKPLENKRIISS